MSRVFVDRIPLDIRRGKRHSLHGCTSSPKFPIPRGIRTFYCLGIRTFYCLGIVPLILWESNHLSSGIRDIFLGIGTFYPLGTILSSGNDFILWESDHLSSGKRTTYPLGNGPIILWDSGHPLGNGTWETGHAILWESDHLSSGKHLLGIGNLGDGFRWFPATV